MNSTEFIEYWDKTVREWYEKRSIPKPEELWFSDNDRLKEYSYLMLGAYMGNPVDCSVAILNYNPGCEVNPDASNQDHIDNKRDNSIARLMAPCYSEIATRFPLWEDDQSRDVFLKSEGFKWWQQRKNWIQRLVPNSNKYPFALEICAWHSPKWNYIKLNDEILKYIKGKVIPVFKEAIKSSDLKVGISIGRSIGDFLEKVGFKNKTAEILNIKGIKKWQPLDVRRWYRIYRSESDGILVLNTYAQGSNKAPSKRFHDFEQQLIEKIKRFNYEI